MDKLVQFGRKAWFIVRVMSGYEERRIRSYRLQLQKRLEMAIWKPLYEAKTSGCLLWEDLLEIEEFSFLNLLSFIQAQARKEELRKQPEQMILSEVRQVVQQMQALNQHLEEAETAIDEYFKPIDKNAKIIMDMQMDKEEKQMKEMAKVMQEQAKMQREIAMRRAEATSVECKNDTKVTEKVVEIPPNQEAAK
ncbi:hypothetical protein EJB05_37949, partial [Eragrostis curvula]